MTCMHEERGTKKHRGGETAWPTEAGPTETPRGGDGPAHTEARPTGTDTEAGPTGTHTEHTQTGVTHTRTHAHTPCLHLICAGVNVLFTGTDLQKRGTYSATLGKGQK